jgi:hypothetical protein
MKTNLKKISYWASVSAIGIVIGISLQFAKAWTEPTATAPGGNIGAPITTGATQEKSGGLVLNYSEIKSGGEPTINFHRPGIFATGIKLRGDNRLWAGGWSVPEGGAEIVAQDLYIAKTGKWASQFGHTQDSCYWGVATNAWDRMTTETPTKYAICASGYYMAGVNFEGHGWNVDEEHVSVLCCS